MLIYVLKFHMEEINSFILKKDKVKATTQTMPPPTTQYDDYD